MLVYPVFHILILCCQKSSNKKIHYVRMFYHVRILDVRVFYYVRILDVRMYYIREKHHPSCLPTQNVPAVFQFGLNLSRRDQCRVLHRHRGPPSHPTRPPPPARNGSTTPSTPPPTTRPLKRPSTYWRTSGTATPAIRTVTR